MLMRAVTFLIVLALAGCAGELPAPPEIAPEVTPLEWAAGALRAAEMLGCERVIWQLQTESFAQAVTVYARNYTRGDCLILQPHHGGADYFLGYAGQFGGCECGPLIAEWPGVPVYTLSDDLHSVRL